MTGYRDKTTGLTDEIVSDFKNSGPSIEDGTLRYEVETYQMWDDPENELPEYHYDYTFTLWGLKSYNPFEKAIVILHG